MGLLALKCFSWLFGHSLPQYFVRNLLEPSASLFSCLNFFNRLVSGQPQSLIRPLEVLSRNYEHKTLFPFSDLFDFDFGESFEPKESL